MHMRSKYHLHTAISRKVVGKSARDNSERYCEWFWVLWSLKKFETMAREPMDVCLQLLKERTKVGSIASVSGTVYWSYRHITFQDCRVHSLYRNSCISIALTIGKKLACWPVIFSSFSGDTKRAWTARHARLGNLREKNETHILFLGISPSRVSRAPHPLRACPRPSEKREKISPVLQAKKNLEIDTRPSSLILFLLY